MKLNISKGIYLFPVLFIAALLLPKNSRALTWQDLWQSQDKQALDAYQQQHYKQAAEQFQQAEWKAAAHYQAGDYQQAIESLSHSNSSDALYNKGNAYAKLGQLQAAIDAYEQALKANPDNADAQYNKELLEKELEKQKQQQEENSDSNKDNQEDNKEGDQEQQQTQQQQEQQQDQQKDSQQQQNETSEQANKDQQQQADSESEQKQATPEQQEKQQHQEKQQAAEPQDNEAQQQQAQQQAMTEAQNEMQQANEQWLKRIPDDPAGLLKRKFAYQYRNRNSGKSKQNETW